MMEYDQMVDVVEGWLKQASPDTLRLFLETPKDKLLKYHHTFGRTIRNEFGLWQTNWNPEIDENGCDCSPFHPDQISFSIIEDVWNRLQHE